MHDDVYQLYLDEIAAIRPMDTEEESLLLEKLKSGDTTVRTRLMEGYLPFIAETAKAYVDQGLPMGDLVQEANMALIMAVMVGADLNGPTIGGIFTVVGFSATGKHLRNILPVMAGVLIASEAKSWNITDPSAILALLLSTTLAPIAGEFGIIAGVIAGFLHSSVALNVGIVYGGMNLYNNGFAGGLVAMFLVPVIQSIRDRRARARGGLSL